jgi:TRAP-type C4-dicarboxylate transport system substrate-binding protein
MRDKNKVIHRITQTVRVGASIATVVALVASALPAIAQVEMRVAGITSSNRKHVDIERPFFDTLAKNSGVNLKVNYNAHDSVGMHLQEALRHVRTGAFDVLSVPIGLLSRDDPFFEGLDLVGVSTDMNELRKVVGAYRDVFDKRLQSKFNAKVLMLWPYGPQVFYCNAEIKSLDDLKGQKVRTYTASMSALVQHFGGTPVTLQFPEVYPALQRGVANCAVTSPTSGNTGNWPEVTSHLLSLSVANGVTGHFVNLDHWKRYSPADQKKLEAEFKKLEAQMWELAIRVNEDATNCNLGRDSCKDHGKFKMKPVEVTSADARKVKAAASAVVLPIFKQACNRVDPACATTWNNTVGKASGLRIE